MSEALPEGVQKEQDLRFAGFSDDDINKWKGEASTDLLKGGFSQDEVKQYWGVKDPNTKAMKTYVTDNLNKAVKENPKVADTYMDAFKAGLEHSSGGLISLAALGKAPDITAPDNSDDRWMNIASQIGTVVGDIPAMVAGGFVGSLAGAPVGGAVGTAVLPGVGTLGGIALGAGAGGTAGAFALPAALRKIMMDHYEKGDIKTAGEFWDRLSSTSWEAIKQAGVGVATFGAGNYAKVGLAAAKPIVQNLGAVASEITAMTVAGKAIEGHLPNADDFINGGIVIAGLHGGGMAIGKLREIYSQTGVRPEDVAQAAAKDPILRQDILSENPKFLKPEEADQLEKFSPKQLTGFNPDMGIEQPTEDIQIPKEDVEVTPTKDGEVKLFNDKIPRSEAEMKVLGRLGEQSVPSVPFKEQIKGSVAKFYYNYVDELNYIKVARDALKSGETLEPSKDPFKLATLAKSSSGKVNEFITTNTIDFKTGKATGEGLGKILADIPNQDRDGMIAFALSKRAIEKSTQLDAKGKPIETGIPLDAAQEVVAQGDKTLGPVLKRLADYQQRVMKYGLDAGLISQESADKMTALNKDYIPFYRLQEIDELSGKSKGGTKVFSKMTGSDAKILDPIQSILQNTAAIVRASEENNVKLKLLDLVDKNPEKGSELFRKAEVQQRPVNIDSKEITKFLKGGGIDPSQIPDDVMTVFRPKAKLLADNEFNVFRDGKQEVWQTKPEFADSIKALQYDPGITNWWYKTFFKGTAKALRAGTTGTPDFMLRNAFRDQLDAGVQSKYGQIPFVDALVSLKHMFGKSELYQDYLNSGAASGAFGEVSKYIEEDVWKLNKETGFMNATWNVIKNPLDAYKVVGELYHGFHAANEFVEQIPRFTEFRKAGGGLEGAAAAQEVTVNFARMGAKMKALNAIIPFMNAGVQGFDKAIRAAKDNPVRFAANAFTMITLPSYLLWNANKDDSRYKSAPNWEKDLFWIIPVDKWEPAKSAADAMNRADDLRRQRKDGTWEVNNGTVFKLPKPFEIGILFGSLPERIFNSWHQSDPEQMKGFLDTVKGGLPNVSLPTLLVPMAEQYMNKVIFTGNQITPHNLQNQLPETQYTEYTSETAKQLGKLIGYVPGLRDLGAKDTKLANPMVVDNYIREYSGTLGTYVVQLADKALHAAGVGETKVPPATTLADIPFVKAFIIRNPSAKTQALQDFYDNYDKTSATVNSFQALAKSGNIEAAQKLMKANQEDFAKLGGIAAAISNQNATIRKIVANPNMTRDDKRQLIDGFYYRIWQEADMGNKLMKNYRQSLEQNK